MSANTQWYVTGVIPKEVTYQIDALTSEEAEELAKEWYNFMLVTKVKHWSEVEDA